MPRKPPATATIRRNRAPARMRVGHWIPLVALGLLPSSVAAGATPRQMDGEAADTVSAPPVARAAEREGALRIDGLLSEGAWSQAQPITSFVQGEPVEGAPPEERTEVRVLFDGDAVYVGARLRESDPGLIARQLVRRDQPGQFDYFTVSLDPNRDRRTGYAFRVSAAGVQRDAFLYDDTREDQSWDAVWESAVHVGEGGWSVEMRIPLSQIRYDPSSDAQTWGVNFERRRLASNERTYFVLESRQRHGKVSIFAPLAGLELSGDGGHRIELSPYSLVRARTGPAGADNPFFDGRETDAQIGLGLRYGLGTAFTLDAAVNPDFGQVEVDPAVINLGAFETHFDEKRPFFVEDARVFDFTLSGRQNGLFYSRRIGRRPSRASVPGAGYRDVPDASTILGAAKMTGRTQGGLSMGALAAVTGRESGRAHFAAGDSVVSFAAEPRTGYGVVRLQQDVRDGATVVGGIVTGLRRDLDPADGFGSLPREAFSAGLDFEHTWSDREWALTGLLASTLVRGSTQAITSLQRSAGHYFQRPDAIGLGVDTAATSLFGAEWRLQLDRRSGRHWTGGIWLGERTPAFAPNDLGFSQGSEKLDAGTRITYREIEPQGIFRDYRLSLTTFHNWRHEALDDPWSLTTWGDAHKSGALHLSGDLTFLNYWDTNVSVSYSPEFYSDSKTRGGPLMTDPSRWTLSLRGNTDRRKALAFGPNLRWSNGAGGSTVSAAWSVTVRPSPRFELRVEPEYALHQDRDQYVGSTGAVPYEPTYGRRYLFGDLERHSASLETRLNYTFTPALTLQLFAQPLISGADYVTYKQLAAAKTFDFRVFRPGEGVLTPDGEVLCAGGDICAVEDPDRGLVQHLDLDADGVADHAFGDRDFSIRSLRGNAVLRWEYRPGSTLYLVWQQQRSRELDTGVFDAWGDARDLLGAAPENILIVKASYWLNF